MIYDEADERLTWVRHLAKRHDLIQQNPKGPDVRLDGELVVLDGLWSSPLHREFSSFFGLIHILILLLKTKCRTQIFTLSQLVLRQRALDYREATALCQLQVHSLHWSVTICYAILSKTGLLIVVIKHICGELNNVN